MFNIALSFDLKTSDLRSFVLLKLRLTVRSKALNLFHYSRGYKQKKRVLSFRDYDAGKLFLKLGGAFGISSGGLETVVFLSYCSTKLLRVLCASSSLLIGSSLVSSNSGDLACPSLLR